MDNLTQLEAEASTRSKSTFGKPGQILHGQARELVANVMTFMKKEAESIKTKGRPLIPFDNYKARARAATGINETLYESIRKESKKIEAGELSSFCTPARKKNCSFKKHVHAERELAIHNIVNEFKTTTKKFSTVKELHPKRSKLEKTSIPPMNLSSSTQENSTPRRRTKQKIVSDVTDSASIADHGQAGLDTFCVFSIFFAVLLKF